jgi:beta-xylosidase
MSQPLYKNSQATIDERVEDLMGRMTLEEKILQLTSLWLDFNTEKGEMAPTSFGGQTPGIDLDYFLNIGIGQITRPFGSRPVEPGLWMTTSRNLMKR